MPARIDQLDRRAVAWPMWRPLGLGWLIATLVAAAIGLLPGVVLPADLSDTVVRLPVLQCLAVGQTGFLLTIYPVALAGRMRARRDLGQTALPLLSWAGELLMLLLAAGPFYIVAAWMSDGVAADVVRALLLVLVSALPAVAGAALLARGGTRLTLGLLWMTLLAVGLPAGSYFVMEFIPAGPVDMVWNLSPVTLAWSVARVRQQSWLPGPMWAWLLWPGISAAGLLIGWVGRGRR